MSAARVPARERIQRQLLPVAVLIGSLWATVTNLIAASVAFIILAPAVPYSLLKFRTIPREISALLMLYGYFLVSTLTYAPISLLEPQFYRRDGNFFVTFLPVLVGAVVAVPINVERVMRSFLKWVTAINAAFIAVYLSTGGTILLHEAGVYHFLFIAHNAAGGYLASVTALAIGLYLTRKKTPIALLILAVNALGLALTVSRGSWFGIGMAVLVVIVLKERFTKLILLAVALVFGVVLYYAHAAWVLVGRPLGVYSGDVSVGPDITGREATIFDRLFFLWPQATDLFLKSPIFGTGFGSFNDLPYHLVGIPGVMMYNRPSILVFSAAHAHNTYLHVLAETGLVGFVLLLLMLREIWRLIQRFEPASVRLALLLAFWTAVFASLTEHRLVTPSEMLPFTILYGLALARRNWDARSDAALAAAT